MTEEAKYQLHVLLVDPGDVLHTVLQDTPCYTATDTYILTWRLGRGTEADGSPVR